MIGQNDQALDFTGDTDQTGDVHRSDRCSTKHLQKQLKHLLTSSTNQTWWVAFVNDQKQGNEPYTQVPHPSRSKRKQIKYARKTT
jgi:hypothetical protein